MFVGVKNHGFSTVVSAFITGLTSNDVCLAVVASPQAAVVGECQEGIYVAQGRSPDRKVHSIFHSPPGIPRARAGWGRGALEPPPFPLPLQTAPCTQRKPSARPTRLFFDRQRFSEAALPAKRDLFFSTRRHTPGVKKDPRNEN